ncbi:MAG TPA: VOC family protein [Candidatus Acidoferrales bacterium]|nr:VOC family protein [Candidatus Acidoferrales bacterium]
MQQTIRLSQIHAIMLGVRDLPQALAFYKEKLGLKVLLEEPQLALLECGTVLLGLSRGHAHAVPHVAGATEVVFRVETVRAAHRALTAQGVSFVSEPHQVTPTDWAAHFRDRDGHLLSIFGPEGQA